jgi:hypothetical protein
LDGHRGALLPRHQQPEPGRTPAHPPPRPQTGSRRAVIPSDSKPAVGAYGLGAGLISDPDEIVATRSRSRAEGDSRLDRNTLRHHLGNLTARGSKASPRMHRCRRTDARKRKERWLAGPPRCSGEPLVRVGPNAVHKDLRRGNGWRGARLSACSPDQAPEPVLRARPAAPPASQEPEAAALHVLVGGLG